MPVQQTPIDGASGAVVDPPRDDEGEGQVRDLAIKQIERKRRFHTRAFAAAAVGVLLVSIWAITEYHNAGGWPTSGFSQSSSIPHKWNSWIIYPIIGLSLFVVIDWWHTYRHRPITEEQIRREMDRLRGAH